MAPAKATASARPKSPIYNYSTGEVIPNGPMEHKINRISLAREANCSVISVESPSTFWVRLSNHITDSVYLKPRTIAPIQHLIESLRFKYVFAPRDANTYRRARVLRTTELNGEIMALVHFIDFGDRSWVGVKALAHMDKEYYFHPWQAIGCCLMAIAPKPSTSRALDANQQPIWTEQEKTAFKQVIEQFTDTKIEVIYGSVESNDSRAMIKVNLLGRLKGATATPESNDQETSSSGQETKPQLESIGVAFARKCAKTVVVSREMLDATKQYQYETTVPANETTPPDPATLEEWQLKLGKIVDTVSAYQDRSHLELWSNERNPEAKGTQIPLVTLKWLEDNDYTKSGRLMLHVEGACTVSPYEFYARPLKEKLVQVNDTGTGTDDERLLDQANAIIDANKEMQDFVDTLNSFYGEPQNRRCIDRQAVLHALQFGDRAYGVVERTDDVAQFTGSWQRIELIARQESGGQTPQAILVRVRYLDAGGTDIKQLDGIFEIHPDHAERPPFCIQLSLFGLLPKQQQNTSHRQQHYGGFAPAFDDHSNAVSYKWSVEAKEAFKTLLREDVPLSANVLFGRLNKVRDKEPITYLNDMPYKRPNVIFIGELVVRGENSSNRESIDDQLVSQGHAISTYDRPAPVEYYELLDVVDFHT